MADPALDVLRRDAFLKRVNGVAGGLRIAWAASDKARIHDHVASIPLSRLVGDVSVARSFDTGAAAFARRKLSEQGIAIRDAHPSDRKFLFIISSADVDLAGDVITQEGIDCASFLRNPAILNAHDSSALPIASSAAPVVSGKTLTAIAKFPRSGVSDASDQVAAAIRASLVRGASIGFVPLRWSFTKDPTRPFGVDFQEIRLLEWSVCAVPCNSSCLYVGAIDGQSSSRSSSRILRPDSGAMAERRGEARVFAARARSVRAAMGDDAAAPTREQRLAEARNFRRVALGEE